MDKIKTLFYQLLVFFGMAYLLKYVPFITVNPVYIYLLIIFCATLLITIVSDIFKKPPTGASSV